MAKSARGALKPRGRDRFARAFAERVRTTARLNAFGAKTRATWEKISTRDFFPAKIGSPGGEDEPRLLGHSNLRTNASARAVEAPRTSQSSVQQ